MRERRWGRGRCARDDIGVSSFVLFHPCFAKMCIRDSPYVDETKVEATLTRPEGLALERKVAARSMVLLKNENKTLPLAKSVKRIAVIGTCLLYTSRCV